MTFSWQRLDLSKSPSARSMQPAATIRLTMRLYNSWHDRLESRYDEKQLTYVLCYKTRCAIIRRINRQLDWIMGRPYDLVPPSRAIQFVHAGAAAGDWWHGFSVGDSNITVLAHSTPMRISCARVSKSRTIACDENARVEEEGEGQFSQALYSQ